MLVHHAGGLVQFEIADDSALALTITKRDLIANAEAATAQYPQYRGHWDGPEWTLIRLKRRVKTKLGVAFEEGEIALATLRAAEPEYDLPEAWTAWSVSNRINTSVPLGWAEEVTAA